MQINQVNFLLWYNTVQNVGFVPMPYAYWRDRERCNYMPIAVPGEPLSFYINTAAGVGLTDAATGSRIPVADLILSFHRMDNDMIVADSVGILQSDVLDAAGNYNLYSTLIIPPNTSNGQYYFKIRQQTSGEYLLTSGPLIGRTDTQQVLDTTTYCRFRHDRFYYNIWYHHIPAFYQQFRINISKTQAPLTSDVQQYFEITTNESRIAQSSDSKEVTVEAYYFDENALDAATIMIKHKYLELNGNLYGFKEAFKPVYNPLRKMSKAEAILYDQTFARLNRC